MPVFPGAQGHNNKPSIQVSKPWPRYHRAPARQSSRRRPEALRVFDRSKLCQSLGEVARVLWINHGKTIGKPEQNSGFMGIHRIYLLVK